MEAFGNLRQQGAALMKEGRFVEAADALRQALAENAADESTWRLLGGALASSGDKAGAVDAFERAVALAPGSAKNHYNLALALHADGRDTDAAGHLRQSLVLDPGYDQARSLLDSLAPAVVPSPPPPLPDPEPPVIAAPPVVTAPPVIAAPPVVTAPPVIAAPPSLSPPWSPSPPSQAPPPPPPAYRDGAPTYSAGIYAPPPVLGTQTFAGPTVNGTPVLVMGIISLVGLFFCFIPGALGIAAWIMGNNALRTLDQGGDQSARGTVSAGRICGIISTGLFGLGMVGLLLVMLIGAAVGN